MEIKDLVIVDKKTQDAILVLFDEEGELKGIISDDYEVVINGKPMEEEPA